MLARKALGDDDPISCRDGSRSFFGSERLPCHISLGAGEGQILLRAAGYDGERSLCLGDSASAGPECINEHQALGRELRLPISVNAGRIEIPLDIHRDIVAIEENPLLRLHSTGRLLHTGEIDKLISILCICQRQAIIRIAECAARPKERIAGDFYILFRGNQDALLRIDLPGDGNLCTALRRAAAPIAAILQLCRSVRQWQIKETGTINLISDSRSIAAIKKHLAGSGIGSQGEAPHIDDAGGAYRDAFIREEIHIAADLPILQRIHDAIDVDLVIHHIDLVVHLAQI